MNLINTFHNWILTDRWYSKNTADNYTRTIINLDNFIRELTVWSRGVEDCELIKYSDISLFLMEERDNGLIIRTLNNHIFAIRLFLKMCMMFDYNVFDYRKLEPWKEYKKKIWFLTEEEEKLIINYAKKDKTKDEVFKTRDLAILLTFINTWIRVQELCNIKVKDIAEEIQIEWKWGTLRPTYLFNEHLRLINLYLLLRSWKHIDSEYLFCSHANNSKWHKLSRASVEKIIRDMWVNAWIKQDVFPHKLRHTFATRLLKNWTNLYYIQQLLWHKNISTTENYLWATNIELKNELSKVINV